jgi:NAD(P)H-dependent FMN reductase
MGASTGMIGTARAQYHLRQVFVFLNVYPVNEPEVMIAHAAAKFGADGTLTDATTREKIRDLLQKLVEWTERLRLPKAPVDLGLALNPTAALPLPPPHVDRASAHA